MPVPLSMEEKEFRWRRTTVEISQILDEVA
jgi:hypothetical protein